MRYLTIAAIIMLASCTAQKPIYSIKSNNNKDYKVEYLFEHDGCKVYRFLDGGNTVYFTSCNGETASYHDSTVTKNSIIHTK